MTRRAFTRSNAVVCVSRYTWNAMCGAGLRRVRAASFPNGGDRRRSRFSPKRRPQPFGDRLAPGRSHPPDGGHVSERKGQDIVIRALAQRRDADVVHYLMAGLPTKEREFGALARELGVADRVHFLGRVDSAASFGS